MNTHNFSKKKGEPKKQQKKVVKMTRVDTQASHPFVDKRPYHKNTKIKKEESDDKPQKTHKI